MYIVLNMSFILIIYIVKLVSQKRRCYVNMNYYYVSYVVISISDGMTNAVAELSANEQQLKRMLQDVELERGGMAERTEYMESRVQELEGVEISLLQRIKNYENNEVRNSNVWLVLSVKLK